VGFEDLEVWQKAHKLVLDIYKVTEHFPNTERFRLTDQLCRSAASIPANIAEGKGRDSNKGSSISSTLPAPCNCVGREYFTGPRFVGRD